MTTNIYNMADTWNAIGTTFDAIKMNVTDGAASFPVGAAASQLINIQTNATQRFGVRSPHFALGADITPFLNLVDIWNTSGAAVGIKYNVTDTASTVASLLMDLQVGGASKFNLTKAGAGTFAGVISGIAGTNGTPALQLATSGITTGFYASAANRWVFSAGGGAMAEFLNTGIQLVNTAAFSWTAGSPAGNTADTYIYRDAANVVAQRNSTTAQQFNLYETFTDAANYSRVSLLSNGTLFELGTFAAGTGTKRQLYLEGGAQSVAFTLGGTAGNWNIQNSAGHLLAGVDNTTDIGASGATRPRNYYGASWVKYSVVTLASLSASFNSAASAGVGAQAFVTDLTTASFVINVTAAGGGTLPGPVYSDGTQWKVG